MSEGQPTREDEFTLSEAVSRIEDLPSAKAVTVNDGVWATVHCDSDETGAVLETVFKERGVTFHKADRQEGFVSVVVEKFKDEI